MSRLQLENSQCQNFTVLWQDFVFLFTISYLVVTSGFFFSTIIFIKIVCINIQIFDEAIYTFWFLFVFGFDLSHIIFYKFDSFFSWIITDPHIFFTRIFIKTDKIQ